MQAILQLAKDCKRLLQRRIKDRGGRDVVFFDRGASPMETFRCAKDAHG